MGMQKHKLMHELVALQASNPIIIRSFDYDYFKYPWHYHSEYEVMYISEGEGETFVADDFITFEPGTIVFMGSEVPHYSRCLPSYYLNQPHLRVKGIILHLEKEFMSHAISNYPDLNNIKMLLENSSHGISFLKPENQALIGHLKKALTNPGLERFIAVLNLLNEMSNSTHYKMIGSHIYGVNYLRCTNKRVEKVLAYLSSHFLEPINLNEVAEIAAMNISAFCRFFKEKTGKTCIQYVLELRISHAKKLLLNESLDINQVALECGFNTITHFNRSFKRITKVTPTCFRELFKA